MENNKNPLVEAAAEFLSRGISVSSNKNSCLNEEKDQDEDESVTKHVSQKHGDVYHVASEGSHHIYAKPASGGRMKYIHHDSSTKKTTSLGTHGHRATESMTSDMAMNAADHDIHISDKLDDKMKNWHDSN